MPRKVNTYSQDFKESSAKLAVELDQPISHTGKDLGIHVTTLHGCISKFHPESTHKTPNQEIYKQKTSA